MHSLLDRVRVMHMPDQGFLESLRHASVDLKILDPEHGEEELINLVAAELAKLSLPLRQPGALVLCISLSSQLTPTSPLNRCEIIFAYTPLLNQPSCMHVSLSLSLSLALPFSQADPKAWRKR